MNRRQQRKKRRKKRKAFDFEAQTNLEKKFESRSNLNVIMTCVEIFTKKNSVITIRHKLRINKSPDLFAVL